MASANNTKPGTKAAAVIAKAKIRQASPEEVAAGEQKKPKNKPEAASQALVKEIAAKGRDLGLDLGRCTYSEREAQHMLEFVTVLRAYNKQHPEAKLAVVRHSKRFELHKEGGGGKISKGFFAPSFLAYVTTYISKKTKA